MSGTLILGIILAMLGGIANNAGALLQKYAINKIPKEERKEGFAKKLFKNPLWIIGILLVLVASGVLITFAQFYVGGTLIPGLMSIGLIVLTIGAIKLLGEKLTALEIIAIFILIIGVALIGLSALEINNDEDMLNLSDLKFVLRLSIYSIVCFVLWITSRQLGKHLKKGKTIFLSLGASFPFALANVWMQPLMYIFSEFFDGIFNTLNIILFIISVLIVAVVNLVGIGHLQDAFKYGDASKVYPIGLIPQQIASIILFYGIYLKSSPQPYSIYLIIGGVILVLVAGFLLGRRQGMLETLDIEKNEADNEIQKEIIESEEIKLEIKD